MKNWFYFCRQGSKEVVDLSDKWLNVLRMFRMYFSEYTILVLHQSWNNGDTFSHIFA